MAEALSARTQHCAPHGVCAGGGGATNASLSMPNPASMLAPEGSTRPRGRGWALPCCGRQPRPAVREGGCAGTGDDGTYQATIVDVAAAAEQRLKRVGDHVAGWLAATRARHMSE
jgi:hypothetical protein